MKSVALRWIEFLPFFVLAFAECLKNNAAQISLWKIIGVHLDAVKDRVVGCGSCGKTRAQLNGAPVRHLLAYDRPRFHDIGTVGAFWLKYLNFTTRSAVSAGPAVKIDLHEPMKASDAGVVAMPIEEV